MKNKFKILFAFAQVRESFHVECGFSVSQVYWIKDFCTACIQKLQAGDRVQLVNLINNAEKSHQDWCNKVIDCLFIELDIKDRVQFAGLLLEE